MSAHMLQARVNRIEALKGVAARNAATVTETIPHDRGTGAIVHGPWQAERLAA